MYTYTCIRPATIARRGRRWWAAWAHTCICIGLGAHGPGAPPLSLPPDWARTVLPCQVQACSGRQKAPCAQGVACRNTSSCAAPCCTASERSQHALKCRVSDAHRYNSLYRAFIHSLIQATQSLDSQACSFDQKVNENNENPWEMASERRQQTTGVHVRETCK